MEADDRIMSTDQCDFMDYIDEELAAILGEDFAGSLSPAGSDSSSSSTLININNPQSSSAATAEPPQVGGSFESPNILDKASSYGGSAPVVLNFGNAKKSQGSSRHRDEEAVVSQVYRINEGSKESRRAGTATRRLRPPSQTYDHIMAERKRREELSQRFVALSAIVPGLKKMDKTSVLGDTIKYLKHLQERVKMLEEQAARQTEESVVLVKKSHIVEDEGSSDEGTTTWKLQEIEARICGKSILLKIHCHKRKGVLISLLAEVENLNLAVVSTSVTPFGALALDITITAEMDNGFALAATDIVRALRSALQVAG